VSFKRDLEAVRNEIILSASEYLSQRQSDDQDKIVKDIQSIVDARTENAMISAGREAVSGLFGEGAIREFVEEVVGLFAASKLPVSVIYNDNTAKLYYLLRISMKDTFFSKLVQS